VPANRIGHYQYTAAQLMTLQEVITLVVFCGFSVWYLKEPLKWNYLAGFALMVGAVFVIFKEW
ncbi:MAG: DMT family protein, partial [Nitrospiraceae bacterium]